MTAITAQLSPQLSGVPETLLITLAARLVATRDNPDLGFVDPAAQAVGDALAFDPGRFAGDRASMRGSIVRSLWFDGVARQFVADCPQGLVVSIGSGLDTRANRIAPPPGITWVDLDFPEVIALREALVPSLPNVRHLAGDGTEVAAWVKQLDWEQGRPLLVLAEGVSMYLDPGRGEAWVRDLVDEARRRASPLTFALDLASPLMARHGRRNPSVGKTSASFSWGVRSPADLTRIAPGLALITAYDVAGRSGTMSYIISNLYRLITGRPVYSCALFTAAAP
ncbi:class I SAM-dependent methyltransferase [Sphingomonas endophytica]|uniref:O-methyltransferase involved in polyketide biosynthesis n=1 Tax=Sphingomonas endophytica TaxID=869719 RepID=A0ABR6N6W6_9SPHN|nr:class I SAM-dependent methyltransferase [Sphingomonas endophytica]MBB5726539.1 O-methyltransferase involved in polyketide biosynthesis [Sphingomonas endophytica]